jgi:hypothetical protein
MSATVETYISSKSSTFSRPHYILYQLPPVQTILNMQFPPSIVSYQTSYNPTLSLGSRGTMYTDALGAVAWPSHGYSQPIGNPVAAGYSASSLYPQPESNGPYTATFPSFGIAPLGGQFPLAQQSNITTRSVTSALPYQMDAISTRLESIERSLKRLASGGARKTRRARKLASRRQNRTRDGRSDSTDLMSTKEFDTLSSLTTSSDLDRERGVKQVCSLRLCLAVTHSSAPTERQNRCYKKDTLC